MGMEGGTQIELLIEEKKRHKTDFKSALFLSPHTHTLKPNQTKSLYTRSRIHSLNPNFIPNFHLQIFP